MRPILAIVLASLCAPLAAAAQRPLNLDFERPGVGLPELPWGWSLGWSAFAPGPRATFVLDDTVHVRGTRSLRIRAADQDSTAAARELTLQIPAGFARGRTIRLTGMVRTRALTGRTTLRLEAWGDRVVPAGDSLVVAGRGGDTEWSRADLMARFPDDPSIHSLVIVASVQGSGTAWFDALELRVDGVAVTALPSPAPPPTATQLRWLATRTVSFAATDLAPGETDDGALLTRLSRSVGDAEVVGLGESTHGTREFFQAKHRLLQFLVRRHGFDLFALEANQLAVEQLNAYVLGGPGTTRQAMRVLFRVWNTEEVEALVDWARRHNAIHPTRPVRFLGYDMQDHRTPLDTLLAFLQRVEPGITPRVPGPVLDYGRQRSYVDPSAPDSARRAWSEGAETLWTMMRERRATWLAAAPRRADTAAVEWAVHSADLLRQAARLNLSLNSPDRDSLMAANLDWALRVLYPGSRAVVWAHDVHVSHGGDAARSFNGGAQMGAHLLHSFGRRYRAYSLLTGAGAYSATRSFTDHRIIAAEGFPAPSGSVEGVLQRIPRPATSAGVFVDLRVPADDPRGAWLWTPRPIRHIGYSAYDFGFDLMAVMPLEFDGVFYFDRTTPSRLLP